MPVFTPDPERDEDRWYPGDVAGVTGRIPGRVEAPYDVTGLDLSGRILELGVGNGQLRPLVENAGGAYTGIDVDPRAGEMVLDYNLHPDLLPERTFDGIYSRNSIATEWDSLDRLAYELARRQAHDGWAWISLWIGVDHGMDQQTWAAIRIFESWGFAHDPDYLGTNQVLLRR